MKKLLFICTGNICRSPTAEAVFRHKVIECGYEDRFFVDSAGTHGYHIGAPPDHRSVQVGRSRGVNMDGLSARKLKVIDFTDFHPEFKGQSVPDPYYGDAKGFEDVFYIVEKGSERLLEYLLNND